MGSFVRRMRKRKRSLGEVRVLRREEYEGLELNAKVELIRSLIPLGLMHVQALLEDEVESLAGRRYAHADGASGTRHGSNPGTVVLDCHQACNTPHSSALKSPHPTLMEVRDGGRCGG